MTARAFEQTIDVETPELVVLTYSLAGVGSRAMAAIIDVCICVGTLMALVIVLLLLSSGNVSMRNDASASLGLAILVIAQFLIFWGYYVLFEGLMDGQTPGKRIYRLRVVREGGYSVTFGASAARNLVRIIDMQPGLFYLVGMASILISKRSRRVGDFVAGTIVVREEIRTTHAVVRLSPQGDQPNLLQTALDEAEFTLLSRFMDRRATLEPLKRAALAEQIATRLARALVSDGRNVGARLLELYQHEVAARQTGVATRGDTGAGRERQAMISLGMPRWSAFAQTLTQVQKSGLKSLSEQGLRDFVASYRTLSSDLARLRTASAGRDLDEIFFLGRLVAGAHNVLYKDRGLGLRGGTQFLFTEVPREVRRSVGPIFLAAILLFGPAIVAAAAVIHAPETAVKLLPQSMLDRAESGVRRAREGEGYIDDPQILRPVMASSIITNNVQVTFAVFAGGIAAGIFSVIMLVLNGISIGSVVGLYASKGIASLLLAFIAPHGVLELFAICVAGGAGFLLAAALLMPGDRSRLQALKENSRRAVRLIAASTFLLVIAGTLEGMVSPIGWWPLEGKLAVSGVTLTFLVFYLRGGRARSTALPAT